MKVQAAEMIPSEISWVCSSGQCSWMWYWMSHLVRISNCKFASVSKIRTQYNALYITCYIILAIIIPYIQFGFKTGNGMHLRYNQNQSAWGTSLSSNWLEFLWPHVYDACWSDANSMNSHEHSVNQAVNQAINGWNNINAFVFSLATIAYVDCSWQDVMSRPWALLGMSCNLQPGWKRS